MPGEPEAQRPPVPLPEEEFQYEQGIGWAAPNLDEVAPTAGEVPIAHHEPLPPPPPGPQLGEPSKDGIPETLPEENPSDYQVEPEPPSEPINETPSETRPETPVNQQEGVPQENPESAAEPESLDNPQEGPEILPQYPQDFPEYNAGQGQSQQVFPGGEIPGPNRVPDVLEESPQQPPVDQLGPLPEGELGGAPETNLPNEPPPEQQQHQLEPQTIQSPKGPDTKSLPSESKGIQTPKLPENEVSAKSSGPLSQLPPPGKKVPKPGISEITHGGTVSMPGKCVPIECPQMRHFGLSFSFISDLRQAQLSRLRPDRFQVPGVHHLRGRILPRSGRVFGRDIQRAPVHLGEPAQPRLGGSKKYKYIGH